VADGRIFANSALKRNLERLLNNLPTSRILTRASNTSQETQHEDVPAFILADSAYPNRSRIVTTFRNTDCHRDRDIRRLNAKLAGIRYCVENAFGICKARFRLLNRPLESAKEGIKWPVYLITAICIIHNFLINEGDELLEEENVQAKDPNQEDGDGEDDVYEVDEEEGQRPTREILLRHMYWLNSSQS
jgi:hypothetical protein